jgi:hypothetical protein
MSNIPKSQLDAVDTRVEVMLRKLFEGRTVNFEDLNGVDILSPDDDDTLFYNFTLDLWENHPLKTINGQSLKGPGNLTISGGSGSPGGSSGQFQWNDSGAFGGTTGYTWNFGTSQPLSTNGYLLGATSSLEEIDGGALVTTSTTLEPISGLVASVDLVSNKSTTATARLNTNSGATNKFLQVEINRSSPRYFDGTALQDVWHTGTFDPTTKQDTLVSGTNIRTVGGNSLLGSGDVSFPVTSVNTRTGAITLTDTDVPATVVTESGTSRVMANGDAGRYIRFTSGSAKTATFGTGLNVVGQEFHLRNVGANNLTLTPSSTTLNAPAGGTLIVPPGGTVTVKQVAATEFDVFGATT